MHARVNSDTDKNCKTKNTSSFDSRCLMVQLLTVENSKETLTIRVRQNSHLVEFSFYPKPPSFILANQVEDSSIVPKFEDLLQDPLVERLRIITRSYDPTSLMPFGTRKILSSKGSSPIRYFSKLSLAVEECPVPMKANVASLPAYSRITSYPPGWFFNNSVQS